MYRPITKAEFKTVYFPAYRDALPAWEVKHGTALSRMAGPVEQLIWFDLLRSGAYRPTNSVSIFVGKDSFPLVHEHLTIKLREVDPRSHERLWPQVATCLNREIFPPAADPLDLKALLKRSEEENGANPSGKYLLALALMNAYLGNRDTARQWTRKAGASFQAWALPRPDWMIRDMALCDTLQKTLDGGEVASLFGGAATKVAT